ncbi:glycosyltransferase family 2 protein [Sediminitomix flava]|uniref:Glycosyltransferase involved in cell wall biosynthesis n=1 Tax=Sediminitomix flava TaxID=379075 RepID=A0A315ZDR8_SEDFL|nr:glycosyltransferase family A protein [Sediminitomix flava]PWJ43293.1 glycosyltransferase involved in cell wall biosynthesis [Sediminitomix flava]
METNVKVSVIIPAYNAEKYIGETLESVLKQSFTDFECIIVDDGSPDNQSEVIQQFKDHRLSYYKKENGGVSLARNFGLSKAKGEYVAFLDSDDVWATDFLLKRVQFLEGHPTHVAVASSVEYIDANSRPLGEKVSALSKHQDLLTFSSNTQTCPSSYLIRKNILEAHQISFHSELFNTADRFFLHELFKVGEVGLVDEAVMYYRILVNSMSRKYSPKLIQDYKIYLRDVLSKKLIPKPYVSSYKSHFQYTIGAYSFHLGMRFSAFRYLFLSALTSPSKFGQLLKQRKAN